MPLSKQGKKLAVDDYDVLMDKILDVPPEEEKPVDFRTEKNRRQAITDAKNRTRPDNYGMVDSTGKNGKLGNTLTEFIMKSLIKDKTRQQDPREEILKYAKEAEENPYWIDRAYKGNKRVLAATVYETQEEQQLAEKRKRRQ